MKYKVIEIATGADVSGYSFLLDPEGQLWQFDPMTGQVGSVDPDLFRIESREKNGELKIDPENIEKLTKLLDSRQNAVSGCFTAIPNSTYHKFDLDPDTIQ